MIKEQMPLARQMDLAFRRLRDELRYLKSGTVLVQIRNNEIGKFGVKHEPIEYQGEDLPRTDVWMTDEHLNAFRELALGSLEHKKGWTHGEMLFEFAVRKNILNISVQMESNYNMAGLFNRMNSTN